MAVLLKLLVFLHLLLEQTRLAVVGVVLARPSAVLNAMEVSIISL
jgi:hypothetical protein